MANTYDTSGEPLGSTAPKVLYNNASNLDDAINAEVTNWVDRPPFNRQRKTWWGIEQDFYNFLANSGFEPVHLTYVDGVPLVVDRPTQLFDRAGTSYRIKFPNSFPFTLTGTWTTDLANAVEVTDDSLRQDLSSTADLSKGVALVGGAAREVATMEDLKALPSTGSKTAYVQEYYAGAGVINSRYQLDTADVATPGDDFTVVVATDGGGRWKLKHADAFNLKMAGGREDGVTDDLAAWDRLLAASAGKQVEFSGPSVVSGTVNIPGNNIRLRGTSRAAVLKAMDNADFEYTLRAQSRTGIEYQGFTVDSNKAARQGILTTRTVSVSFESCTDCQLVNVIGSNAIGSGSIPGIGISTAGNGERVNVTNCTALNCGVVGKAADGFFCSSSYSINTGNVAINCLDTGHVLESCSYSGIVGCVSISCGVVGAITNATSNDKYGNFINGLRGQDWAASVTGGVQIGVFGTGNLIETSVRGVALVGVASFIGPGINVRRTGTGRVDGLEIQASVRNSSSQGILVDSARRVNIHAKITGPTSACIQFNGDCTDCVVESGTNLFGGTFGVYASNTSQVFVTGTHMQSQTSYGLFAANTAVVTSLMNDIVNPTASHYENKDAGATLNRITLVNGLLSLNSVVAGAPLTATLSKKATLVTGTGTTEGVVGFSAT